MTYLLCIGLLFLFLWIFNFEGIMAFFIKVAIIIIIFGFLGYFIGIGIKFANAGERCQQISQLICSDVIKTYDNNYRRNIVVIQRAKVLHDLYSDLDCSAYVLATCITDNLISK